MGSNFTRIIAVTISFLGVFVLPWWFFIFLLFFFFVKFPSFYEGLIIALIADLLYSVPRDIFLNLPVFFIFACLFFFLSPIIKKQLRI